MQTVKTELAMDIPAATVYQPPTRGMAPMKREYVTFPPAGPNQVVQASSQSIVRFRFPNTGYLDPCKTFLRFAIQGNFTRPVANSNPDTTQQIHLEQIGAHAVIHSFRVFASGQLVEEITNYGEVAKLLMMMAPDNFNDSHPTILQGLDGVIDRQTQFAPSGSQLYSRTYGGSIPYQDDAVAWRYFVIPLIGSGLFGPRSTDYLPLWLLGGDFEIEIAFSPGSRVFRQGAAQTSSSGDGNQANLGTNHAQSYNLKDISLHTQIISLPDTFTAALLERIRGGNTIKFGFETYQVHQSSVQGSTDIINIPAHLSDVTGIFLVRKINSVPAGNPAFDFEGKGITYAQLQVGSNLIPQQPITNDTDLFWSFMQATGNGSCSYGRSINTHYMNWGTPQYTVDNTHLRVAQDTVVAFDLCKYHKSNVLTGMPLEGNATITMKYDPTEFGNNIAGKQVNLCIVRSTRIFILSAEGVAILR